MTANNGLIYRKPDQSCAVAEPFIGFGELRNRCLNCLRAGDWYDNRLDRIQVNREVHLRLSERL